MTTEGQGRTSDPVGFGIPVMIEGPWSRPRIYPEMQGILDNPDGAYAKLREMGKGLFGPNGGGLGGLLGSLTGNSSGSGNNGNGALGGNIGQALGNLFQQPGRGGSRSIPAPGQSPPEDPSSQGPASPPPPQPSQAQNDQAPQDSQAMNDVLRRLFNR